MGKSIALAMPFIIALLIALYVVAYKAGKKVGERNAPNKADQAGSQLLRKADQIFADLMYIENISNDDILTPKSQRIINTWRSDYMKAKNT